MTPIPESPMPEEQAGQPLEEQIPAELEPAPEAVETDEGEQPEAVENVQAEILEDAPGVPAEPEEVEAPPKPPSKFQILLRKIGVWALITLAVFAVCGLLVYFQIYRPVKQNVALLEGQLADAQAALTVSQDELAAAREDIANAKAMLEVSDARVSLYKTMNGIAAAQAALDKKNGQDALKALKEAQAALEELLPVVKQDSPEVADQMDTRLKAAISSLSGDFKTTKSDLETLSALLMQQDKLFLGE